MATCGQSYASPQSFGRWDVSPPMLKVCASKGGATEQSEERTTKTNDEEERRRLFQKFEKSLGFTYEDLLSYHSAHPDFMTPEVEEVEEVEEAKEEKNTV